MMSPTILAQKVLPPYWNNLNDIESYFKKMFMNVLFIILMN